MLTIQGPGGPRTPDRKLIRTMSGTPGFRLPELGAAPADMVASIAAPIIDAASPPSAPDATAADLRARSHGGEMLDLLAQMQRDMLSSWRDPDKVQRLAELADAIPEAASPDLRLALRAVTTRAKVELARDQVAAIAAGMTAA
jgi:hypothetical protein